MINIQYRKGCEPQKGGVLTACSSGINPQTRSIMGKGTQDSGKAMLLAFEASDDGTEDNETKVMDFKKSHLLDHELKATTIGDRSDKANMVTTVDVNQLASCSKNFQHQFAEQNANHARLMPINAVLKFKLLSEIWTRAGEAYRSPAAPNIDDQHNQGRASA